jgi:hypothetical protein
MQAARPNQIKFAQMVDDRASEGQFRIDRRMYDDEAVFEAEMERIFEATWMYVAHESQIPNAGDYIWTEVGRQPVIINRLDDGSVSGVINACSHRGALLTATARAMPVCLCADITAGPSNPPASAFASRMKPLGSRTASIRAAII